RVLDGNAWALRWLLSHHEEVSADPQQRRLGLHQPGDLKEIGSATWIAHALVDIRQQPSGALDPIDPGIRETRGCGLGDGVAGTMQIGGREVVESLGRIAVLSLLQITPHDAGESRILEQIPSETVER